MQGRLFYTSELSHHARESARASTEIGRDNSAQVHELPSFLGKHSADLTLRKFKLKGRFGPTPCLLTNELPSSQPYVRRMMNEDILALRQPSVELSVNDHGLAVSMTDDVSDNNINEDSDEDCNAATFSVTADATFSIGEDDASSEKLEPRSCRV